VTEVELAARINDALMRELSSLKPLYWDERGIERLTKTVESAMPTQAQVDEAFNRIFGGLGQ
jgi:hypothetical protein